MTRLRKSLNVPRHRVAVVEDDPDLRASLVSLFEREGHEVRSAEDEDGAVELVREFAPHLLLLDYYLAQGTGAGVVERMREFESMTQVLLVTGYASEQPARTLLAELDIQGYHDKSDGPARLMVLADAALKHYRVLRRLQAQHAYLRHIVDSAPEIMKLQDPDSLLRAALEHVIGLLRAGGGLVATVNSGLFVFGDQTEHEVSVRAAEGPYAAAQTLADLPAEVAAAIRHGVAARLPHSYQHQYIIIPLETRNGDRGCMLVEAKELPEDAIEPCRIFARQVIQSLENILLYERATVNGLTRLCTRAHGEQRIREQLKLATRTGNPIALLLMDLDHFKGINDRYGHAAGDLVLHRVATALRGQLRDSDVVARWGGEEFVVALPATNHEGARIAAEKLRRAIAELVIEFEGEQLKVTISGGLAMAATGQTDVAALVARADSGLYLAKSAGRNRVVEALAEVHEQTDSIAG